MNLPLPVIYKGFNLPLRTVSASRNGAAPLDTTLAEESARKVLETAEQLALGTLGANSFGGYVLQGATNFTGRMTKVLTTPTGTATNATTLAEILAMKDQAKDAHHHGPFRLYMGTGWDQYLDGDFSTAYPGITLRERLMKIDQIQKIATVDFLSGFNALLIEQSKSTMRIVVGMELTTLRWQTLGGLKLHFLVMAILVPQLRADFNGNTGIVHGNVA